MRHRRSGPPFLKKIGQFERGVSLLGQTYHFHFKGSSLVRAYFKGKSQKYFQAENLLLQMIFYYK